MEQWKEIRGYGGVYFVSSLGRVKSDRWYETILKQSPRRGYYSVGLCSPRKKYKVFLVHRLVLETFIGKPRSGYQCAHLDGNKQNNNLRNLKWVTSKENARHRRIHGTDRIGEDHPMCVLREDDVIDIISMRFAGFKLREISNEFGVSIVHISLIVRRKIWKHL